MVERWLSTYGYQWQGMAHAGHKDNFGNFKTKFVLYPDSGISMDEEIVLGDMIWSYNKAEL